MTTNRYVQHSSSAGGRSLPVMLKVVQLVPFDAFDGSNFDVSEWYISSIIIPVCYRSFILPFRSLPFCCSEVHHLSVTSFALFRAQPRVSTADKQLVRTRSDPLHWRLGTRCVWRSMASRPRSIGDSSVQWRPPPNRPRSVTASGPVY